MEPADILTLLNETMGTDAVSGLNPSAHSLREGLSVTAIPECSYLILRFEVDRSDKKQHYRIAEVAISADLGNKSFEFVKAALASLGSVE
ncbi:MAG: hypothetical protein M3Y72_08100 [Acidobacteriota bacterium]|nr:hypothetical protein [Acidobacteriota bacterium]